MPYMHVFCLIKLPCSDVDVFPGFSNYFGEYNVIENSRNDVWNNGNDYLHCGILELSFNNIHWLLKTIWWPCISLTYVKHFTVPQYLKGAI